VNESIFMHGWATIIGSLATIAIIATALGLMLRVLKAADALKRIGACLGLAVLLKLIPGALINLWLSMSVWERIALTVVGLVTVWWRRPRRQSRKNKAE
jgi:hypothetical protein